MVLAKQMHALLPGVNCNSALHLVCKPSQARFTHAFVRRQGSAHAWVNSAGVLGDGGIANVEMAAGVGVAMNRAVRLPSGTHK